MKNLIYIVQIAFYGALIAIMILPALVVALFKRW